MTLLLNLYSARTKDLCNKASFILRVFKRYLNNFSFAANILLLLLLFSPSLFSQVTHYQARGIAITLALSTTISQKTNLHFKREAPATEVYQALSDIKITSKTLPGKVISRPFKIRRTRGLLSKTTFHVIDGVVSNISFINNGLRFPDTGNPPWQFYKRPPGTIFKIRI